MTPLPLADGWHKVPGDNPGSGMRINGWPNDNGRSVSWVLIRAGIPVSSNGGPKPAHLHLHLNEIEVAYFEACEKKWGITFYELMGGQLDEWANELIIGEPE